MGMTRHRNDSGPANIKMHTPIKGKPAGKCEVCGAKRSSLALYRTPKHKRACRSCAGKDW